MALDRDEKKKERAWYSKKEVGKIERDTASRGMQSRSKQEVRGNNADGLRVRRGTKSAKPGRGHEKKKNRPFSNGGNGFGEPREPRATTREGESIL